MPSPKISDDDESPIKNRKPTNTTPRRSPAVKRANATPRRNVSGNKPTTPKSAPARERLGTKKPEPTLLGDFLLGRPSTKRKSRRRSLDYVKAEMKEAVVNKVQPPGCVKDRVKQWQKASAAATVEDPFAAASEPDEVLVKADAETVDEEDRQRIKFRGQASRPSRRKDQENEEDSPDLGRVKTSPKKRVVSDDHWMMKKNSSRTPEIKLNGGSPLPKDFLKNSALNPPLEKKLEDWAKRTAGNDWSPRERDRRSPSNSSGLDDGIRVFPSKSPSIDDGVNPLSQKHDYLDDGTRAKPIGAEGRRKPYQNRDYIEERETPRKRSSKHVRPSLENDQSPRTRTASGGTRAEGPPPSWTTPSPPPHRVKSRNRKSGSPESLAEVPVGYSAFSVLDIPVGADASAMRVPKPQRVPSLSKVPQVFKKVYNEGLKIVHDTVDPPRTGINQPPSIESWLKGTSDPFIDQPDVPESVVGAARPQNRKKVYEEVDLEKVSTSSDRETNAVNHRTPRQHVHPPMRSQNSNSIMEEEPSLPATSMSPSSNVIEEPTSPILPAGLRRSPATRNSSSPSKSNRKIPFREALVEAFRGESEPLRSTKSAGESGVSFEKRELQQEQSAREFKVSYGLHTDDHQQHNILPDRSIRNSDKPDAHSTTQGQRTFARREAPTTGQHRLSTIASVETFTTSSSQADTSSELSRTTVTQTTLTQNTASTSNTSYTGGTRSSISRQNSKPSGLKRRLTKHSDLLSVLSLPDATEPGRSRSIRSARSIRTARSHLTTATIQSLLQELADDEAKYMRELKTLVDGVIPVLLTCVLSKSESAVAAGLFSPLSNAGSDGSITKPIVDMGIALERLKSLHRRIPLQDPDQLVHWASGAHKIYDDYLTAWRMGFQDVIVNLAPASPSDEESLLNGGMPRNAAGDVLNEDGERVDVAFLLKRPLVRIKYLSKTLKGVVRLKPSEVGAKANKHFLDLVERTRCRHKEEQARLEDQAANNTDATRARNPQDLTPMESVKIDRTRQVSAKDFFDLDIPHSNGQRIGCRVELLLRDKPKDDRDPGDILVCEVDHVSRWLLFPPFDLNLVSARLGNETRELLVMIRGSHDSQEWREVLILTAESEETAREWVEMLGSTPLPPQVEGHKIAAPGSLASLALTPFAHNDRDGLPSRRLDADNTEVPIGETRRKKVDSNQTSPANFHSPSAPNHESLPGSEQSRKRYHTRQNSGSPSDLRDHAPYSPSQQHGESPMNARHRNDSAAEESSSISPSYEEISSPKKAHIAREDGAPPPPAHKSPSNISLNNKPVLETGVSKFKNRRSSSPLKHEYQPSDGSGTSSASDDSDSGYGMMDSDSSEDDDLEAPDLPVPNSGVIGGFAGKISPPESLYSFPNASLAPSQSASQVPYRERNSEATTQGIRLVASISCWSERGHWKELWKEDCSIVVGPGIIEAFVMGASHSGGGNDGPIRSSGSSDTNTDTDAGAERPLVALALTPCVPLRQSNALDIEIRSPPTDHSKLKSSHTVRFRSRTLQECSALYAAIHQARMNNPIYKRLEQERIVGAYGGQSYQAAVGSNRRSSWFGRKKSYRASARAPSATVSDNSSSSFSSAISRLRNMGGKGGFNIDKSTVATHRGPGTVSGNTSLYTSSESTTSGLTPPRTPTSPSLALTGTSNVASLGRSNLKIRLYVLQTSSKWDELGQAFLTVSDPPPGMRQASSLYHGIEKRIFVTSDSKRSVAHRDRRLMARDGEASQVIIDQVLGGGCFSRLGITGICMNVWEDIMGDNGEIGMVAAVGGVSGRTRKWMFQCATAKETAWIFSLVGGRA